MRKDRREGEEEAGRLGHQRETLGLEDTQGLEGGREGGGKAEEEREGREVVRRNEVVATCRCHEPVKTRLPMAVMGRLTMLGLGSVALPVCSSYRLCRVWGSAVGSLARSCSTEEAAALPERAK